MKVKLRNIGLSPFIGKDQRLQGVRVVERIALSLRDLDSRIKLHRLPQYDLGVVLIVS